MLSRRRVVLLLKLRSGLNEQVRLAATRDLT